MCKAKRVEMFCPSVRSHKKITIFSKNHGRTDKKYIHTIEKLKARNPSLFLDWNSPLFF